jgi:hypothetical protein
MIPTETLERALAGIAPPGSRLTALQLGLQLQKHRRRSHRPYSESTILTYKAHPDMQSREFVEAFQSWYAARLLRRQEFARVRFGEFTADDLLAEQGRILLRRDGSLPMNSHAVMLRSLRPSLPRGQENNSFTLATAADRRWIAWADVPGEASSPGSSTNARISETFGGLRHRGISACPAAADGVVGADHAPPGAVCSAT